MCPNYLFHARLAKGMHIFTNLRMGIGVWQTVFMVFGGDQLKSYIKNFKAKRYDF